MHINPIPGVICGLQSGILYVALPATKWRVDLVMANQTISHPRECGIRYALRLVQSAVAGHAKIASVEMAASVTRVGQISLRVDGASDDRGCIAELDVELMIESVYKRRPRRLYDELIELGGTALRSGVAPGTHGG